MTSLARQLTNDLIKLAAGRNAARKFIAGRERPALFNGVPPAPFVAEMADFLDLCVKYPMDELTRWAFEMEVMEWMEGEDV